VRSARREAAYQRGTAALQDQGTLPQVNYDLKLAIARMERLFPASDPVLSHLRADVMKAVEAGDDAEADRLIESNSGKLSTQQREAIEQWRDMMEASRGLDDAMTRQVQEYAEQRRRNLEPFAAPDGSITEVELSDGSKAYYLAGNLNNTLGGVLVATETGERKQVPVSQIKNVGERRMLEDVVNADVDEYGRLVEQTVEGMANGGTFVQGSEVDLMVAGQPFRVTVAGQDAAGNVVFTMEDGSQMPMSSADARRAVYEADKAKIEVQLKEEKEAATLLQQRERFEKGIAGYAEGTPDLSAEASDAQVVAEYLESTIDAGKTSGRTDGHGELLKSVQSEIDRMNEQAQQAAETMRTLDNKAALSDGLSEEEQAARAAAEEAVADARRRRRKWGEIRQALMGDEERRKFEAERQKEIRKAQAAAEKVKPAGEAAGTAAVPTGKELMERFAEQGDAASYVEQLQKEQKVQYRDVVAPQLSDARNAVADYRRGLTDASGEELQALVNRLAQLEAEESAMVGRQQELGKLASSLGRLYAARNKAAMSPHERMMAAMEKENDPQKKVKLAREAFAGDEEALSYLGADALEPQDVYEWVAANLGKGTINWEGIQRGEHYVRGLRDELGRDKTRGVGKKYDTNGINYFLAPEGKGKGIDEIVHSIWEGSAYEMDDVRNALLDMLKGTGKPTDITNRIIDDRIARAEEVYNENLQREAELEEDARREAEDAAIMQMTGMTAEEYDAFISDLERRLAEQEGYRTSEEYFNQITKDNDRENERRAGGGQEAGALAEQGKEGEPGAAAAAGEGGAGATDVTSEALTKKREEAHEASRKKAEEKKQRLNNAFSSIMPKVKGEAERISDYVSNITDGTKGKKQIAKAVERMLEKAGSADLLGVLDECMTILANTSKMNPADVERINAAVERIIDNAKAQGFETGLLPGTKYDEGMKVFAEFVEDASLPYGTRVISETRKPQIVFDGEMVQKADVVVRQHLSEADAAAAAGEGGAGAAGGVTLDKQGNPVDKDGKYILEKVDKIEDITDDDFTSPTRNVELPSIPENIDNAIGANGKPVIIKKNIFEKNAKAHQFSPSESRQILESALYNADLVGQTQPKTRKNHWVAIKIDDKSPITVLEVNQSKDNVEVVGWYTLDARNLERIKRQAEREDGELLILTPKGAAASLSTLPSSISAGKVTNNSSDGQGKSGKNSVLKERVLVEGNENYSDEERILLQYLAGESIDEYVKRNEGAASEEVLKRLYLQGKYADRWSEIETLFREGLTKDNAFAVGVEAGGMAGDSHEGAALLGLLGSVPSDAVLPFLDGVHSFASRLARAVKEVNASPTEAQKEAGNYKKGHVSFGGYDFTIENPKGSVRSGVDASGRPWQTTMEDTYGYILGKYGHDGDHIDMFINDDADLGSWNGRVFVVDQKSEDGSFDEHKVMYGYNTWQEARRAYERNYEPGWWDSHVMQMTGVKKDVFDQWLADSDHKRKPFAQYVRTKNGDPITDNVDQLIADVRERVNHLPTWTAEEVENMDGARLTQLLGKRRKDLSTSRYLLKAAGVEGSGSAKERLLKNNISKAEADIKTLEAEQQRRAQLPEEGQPGDLDFMIEDMAGEPDADASGTVAEKSGGNVFQFGKNVVSLQSKEALEAVEGQKATLARTAPWRDGVEDVTVHTTLGAVRKKYGELHEKAKAGDVEAALQLVAAVAKPEKVKAIAEQHPNARVAFVHAEEATGRNALPKAYATMLEGCGLTLSDIAQTNKPSHTGSDRVGRFIRRARFDGEVEPGAEYIIVDDHVTMGSTLRDLKDYIESKGGKVVAVSTLTASAGGTKLRPTDEQIKQLNEKGITNEQLRELGIADSIDGLTRREAAEILVLADKGGDTSSSRGRKARPGQVQTVLGRVLEEDSIDVAGEASIVSLPRINQFGLNENDPVGRTLTVNEPRDAVDELLDEVERRQEAADKNTANKTLKTFLSQGTEPEQARQRATKAVLTAMEKAGVPYKVVSKEEERAMLQLFSQMNEEAVKAFARRPDIRAGAEHGRGRYCVYNMEDPFGVPMYAEKRSVARWIKQGVQKYGGKWAILDIGEAGKEAEQGEALKKAAEMQAMMGWHGSGALFDAFDHSHMGEGEGNQAFGWGTYVTEVEAIGRQYARNVSNPSTVVIDGEVIDVSSIKKKWPRERTAKERLAYALSNPHKSKGDVREELVSGLSMAKKGGIEAMEKLLSEELKILDNSKIEVTASRPTLYTVDIPDDNGKNYFDWDSEVPSDVADKICERLFEVLTSDKEYGWKTTQDHVRLKTELDAMKGFFGGAFYGRMSVLLGNSVAGARTKGKRLASELLHELGYVGIKYPADYMNGGNADGKKNYVIFDENDAKIVDTIQFMVSGDETSGETAAPVFVSNALKAVEGIRQEKATPEQWLAMIQKAGGLKSGEDKWIGLSEWLTERAAMASQPTEEGSGKGRTVTKQEVLDFIRENQIRVEEVHYGEDQTEEWAILDAFNEEFFILQQDAYEDNPDIDADEQIRYAWDEMCRRYGAGGLHGFNNAFRVDDNGRLEIDDFDEAVALANKYKGMNASRPVNAKRLYYTTEGLKNKREIALVVPTVEPWNKSDQIHFGDAGGGRAVAWVRFGETTDADGKRVLVIDEIQSKRHQEGREKGYVTEEDKTARRLHDEYVKARVSANNYETTLQRKYGTGNVTEDVLTEEESEHRRTLWKAAQDARDADRAFYDAHPSSRLDGGVPDAPFEKNWHEVVMKRMLRYAAENGYDKVAWTKGEQQAERYNIGNVVDKVISYDYPETADPDGRKSRKVEVRLKDGETLTMRVDQSGKVIEGRSGTEGKMLPDVVGKELAKSIMSGEGKDGTIWDANRDLPAKIIEGDGFRVGGEGMKGFYDQILPRFMDKYGKKWGVKTGEVELPEVEPSARTMWGIDVTPEMKASVLQGQPLFQKEGRKILGWVDGRQVYLTEAGLNPNTPIHECTHLWDKWCQKVHPELWKRLVAAMKQTAMWEEIRRNPNYRNIWADENRMASEVHSRLSGAVGEEEFMKAAFKKNTPKKIIDEVKSVLRKFWEALLRLFGKQSRTVGDDWDSLDAIVRMPLRDLVGQDFEKVLRVADQYAQGEVEGHIVTDEAQHTGRSNPGHTLMGVHNISEEKLKKAIKQGGLANPSFAVIDTTSHMHTGYGEISLIPRSSLIDAKTGRNAGTWTADAWTPTYPHVEKQMSDKGQDKFWADLRKVDSDEAIGGRDIGSRLRLDFDSHLDGRDASGMYWWYLYERGQKPEKVLFTSDKKQEDIDAYKAVMGDNKRYSDLDESRQAKLLELVAKERGKTLAELRQDMQALKERNEKRAAAPDAKAFVKMNVKRINEEIDTYGVPYSYISDYINAMNATIRDAGKVNVPATFGHARDVVKEQGLEGDYVQWLEEKEKQYGVSEVIFTGYTPDGDRKYVKNTLANASRLMKQEGRNGSHGGAFGGIGELIAIAAKRVTTLDQIRKERKNLDTTPEEHEAFREKWNSVMLGICNQCGEGDLWTGEARVQEALGTMNPVAHLKREYGVELSKDDAALLNTFIKEVRENYPTGYFETKFERPVTLDEFAVAVVPERTSPEVVKALKDAGLDVRTYDNTGTEEQMDANRRQAAMEAVGGRDDILFRRGTPAIEKANARFNEELNRQINDSSFPKDHIYELGRPGTKLLSTGFPNAEIELSASHLKSKSEAAHHPFRLEDVKDLVRAINNPIAVFSYGDKTKSQNVIAELQKDGKNFVVGIHFNQSRHGMVVSDIRGLYPKDNAEWLNWITQGKLLYADKEKIQNLIAQQRRTLAEVSYLDLNSAAKVVNSFENPKLSDEKIREIYPEYTRAGDEVAEQLGGVTVIWEQQALEPGTKGWYDPNDGSVHVAIDEVEDVDDVKRTVLHEKLGHEGLAALFAPAGEASGTTAQAEVNRFGTFVFRSAGKKLRERILEKADEEGYEWNDPLRLSKAAQEVFADIAADGPATAEEFSLWRKVKHYLIRLLNRLGWRVRGLLNDHDLRYYVLKTGEALKRWNGLDETARQDLSSQSTRYDIMRSRKGKPRKKNDESMSQYLQRLREWEKWRIAEEKAEADGDPMPDKETIDKRWEEKYNADLEAWKRANGIPAGETAGTEAGPGEFPKRGENETPQEYAVRVAEYETRADLWKGSPDYFDYIQKAQDEYRRSYEEWKRRYDLQEAESVDLNLYEGTGGDGPQTFTDEEAEVRAERDMAEAFGVQVDSAGARRHAKLAVIERRKNLESSNAEDAIWLHDFVRQTEELAATMSQQSGQTVTGKMLREALPFIIEGTYWEEVLKDQDGHVVGYADISDQLPIKKGPELDALLAHIKEWYDHFFFALEDAGLRGDAGYIGEGYVNHIWDKGKSDPKAWEQYVENYQRTKSPNMKHREVDTYQMGIDVGLVPKFKDIADMMAYYSRSNNEALANKKFLDDLSFMVVEELNSDGEVVSVLPLLNSEKPDAFTADRYARYHVPGVGDVWVIKDIQKRFANIFGTMRTQDVGRWLEKAGKVWDIGGSTAKKIELALSGFHALALWEVDVAQNGPVAGLADLFKYIVADSAMKGTLPAYAHPEDFKFAASHLVQLGATEDYAAADVNNITGKLREMVKELYKSDNAFKKAAGAAGTVPAILMDWVNKGFDTVLWNYLHDGLKIASMMRFKRQIDRRAEREGLDDETREKLYDEAGQYVNDMFGGQYWELLNVSPGTLKWMRRLLLSPDWLVSTNRHFFANFGFGSLYGDGGWREYLKYNWDNIRRAAGGKVERDELRRFRSRNAKRCYLIGVLFFWNVLYNALNAWNRKRDQEQQREVAEEMRKTNPDYKSPYELAYPDGMKWYDYLMTGNSLGQQTHLFTGRYEDGTETYVKWGKPFREFPEMFIGRHGLEFPAPLIERMKAKANPNIGGLMDFLGALGVRGFEEGYESRELREKYGRTISTLSATARHFIPFGIPTQADKEYKVMDFFMPSSKGFSRYKAVDYFKTFIIDGDMRGIEQTYQAAVMNGVDAEECLKAAIASVKAEQRRELVDGVTDLTGAADRFEAATTYKDRAFWKRKMEQYLGGENHQAMERAAFMENVEHLLSGENDERSWSVATESYLQHATREDIVEDYRVRVIGKAVSDMKRELARMKDSDMDETYITEYRSRPAVRRLFKADKLLGKYKRSKKKDTPGYDALRSKMGGSDDAALMQQIRDLRRQLIEEVDSLE